MSLSKENSPTILIIDDDKRLRILLKTYLSENNLHVIAAQSAEEARNTIEYLEFDLVILDVMMPKENGHEFLRKFREKNQTPIIMLTALGEATDRIKGLEEGADDYLAKPFEPKELLLRINSILKRQAPKADSNKVKFGEFEFDLGTKNLNQNNEPLYITSSEQEMLSILAAQSPQAISRDALASKLGDINERAVDVQIMRLRKKIEDDPKRPLYIQTVRGEGYKLNII